MGQIQVAGGHWMSDMATMTYTIVMSCHMAFLFTCTKPQ